MFCCIKLTKSTPGNLKHFFVFLNVTILCLQSQRMKWRKRSNNSWLLTGHELSHLKVPRKIQSTNTIFCTFRLYPTWLSKSLPAENSSYNCPKGVKRLSVYIDIWSSIQIIWKECKRRARTENVTEIDRSVMHCVHLWSLIVCIKCWMHFSNSMRHILFLIKRLQNPFMFSSE